MYHATANIFDENKEILKIFLNTTKWFVQQTRNSIYCLTIDCIQEKYGCFIDISIWISKYLFQWFIFPIRSYWKQKQSEMSMHSNKGIWVHLDNALVLFSLSEKLLLTFFIYMMNAWFNLESQFSSFLHKHLFFLAQNMFALSTIPSSIEFEVVLLGIYTLLSNYCFINEFIRFSQVLRVSGYHFT